MNKLTRRTFVMGSAALLCAPALRTEAQSAWPARPIRIIGPYPAGGQTDGIARAFGDYLARWRTASSIERAAEQFVGETRALFAALVARMEKEDGELYPLVDREA